MKKLVVLLSAFFLLAGMNQAPAQSPTDKLFDKYSGMEGFTTVHISQELFDMFADMELEEAGDQEVKEVQEMMTQLKYIRILMYEAKEGTMDELMDFKSEMKKFDLEGFSELMMVKEEDEEVKFMARKGDNNKISELLLIINEADEAGFISINGNIDMKTVSKLSKTMKLNGMEHLEELEEEKEK